MLNCKNLNDLLTCSCEESKSIFVSQLTDEEVSFDSLSDFPENNGLYFVFYNNQILYIGKADKQSIKKRCNQYVNESSGATLRKKVECVRKCGKQEAITFIKNNFKARFFVSKEVEKLPVLEEIAIWAFQPRLNAIKPTTFNYEKLQVNKSS
jgi:excinuclease UvrABC nuclease subunit